MNKIKFRGYSKEKKSWFHGSLINDLSYDPPLEKGFVYIVDTADAPCRNVEDVTISTFRVEADSIGQFVGLLDKHFKEIYTGDIVEVLFKNSKRFVAEVVYSERTNRYWLKGETFSCGIRPLPIQFEIIGNAYISDEDNVSGNNGKTL